MYDELPEPDSLELLKLFSNQETREAYRFLYARRNGPLPTMVEWLEHAEAVFGRVNVHSQRRLRDVRDQFVVEARPVGGVWIYELQGRKPKSASDSRAVSPRLEAQVYEMKGRFCQMCGAEPSAEIKLQIDHKIPRAWGGETVLENLEPLCAKHNQGKRDFFESLSRFAGPLRESIGLPDPWQRIGSLLRAMRELGQQTPAELLPIVARETHRGDPARRLRDLRVVLGWDIRARRRRVAGITQVAYELVADKPWPLEGPSEAVRNYERERQRFRREASR